MRNTGANFPLILRWAWRIARLPMLMLLVILEPVVIFACGALALLGLLTTIFFKLINAPHFPTWTMLTISLSFGFALVIYEGVIRALSE